MHELVSSGFGTGAHITVNPDEMVTICNYIHEIIAELENNAAPNIKKLCETHFYTEGIAKRTMAVYPKANKKVLDLYDHYSRAATLVDHILAVMIQTDKNIAEKIFAKLGE